MISILMISEPGVQIHKNIINIQHKLNAKLIIDTNDNEYLGIRKQNLVELADEGWILILDTDETVSPQLLTEINGVIKGAPEDIHGYEIPFQNYFFGQPVYYGGEKYSKVRLFRRKYGSITPVPIHEEVVVKGKIGKLKGVIHHYSYSTPWQVLSKFSRYAWLVAGEKYKAHERVTLKKLLMYGPHMFWARCIKDESWRDGWRGVVLALFFGYMEAIIYYFLLLKIFFDVRQ